MRIKMKKIFALMAVLAFVASSVANAQEEVTKDTLLRANTDTLMKHVRILASSQYEGRMAGSQAFLEAADYCAGVLSSYGVKPFQDEWGQYFQVEYNEIENCNFYTYVNDNDVRVQYVLGRDYVCSSMTGRGYTNAPVVFCGWGIDHHSFNEYAKVDVRGKVVLCLSGVPEFLPGKVTEPYATMRGKAEVAKKHGAIGLVCINMSETCRPYEVQHQGSTMDFPRSAAYSGYGCRTPCRRTDDTRLSGYYVDRKHDSPVFPLTQKLRNQHQCKIPFECNHS